MTGKEMKFLSERMTRLREANKVKTLDAMISLLQKSGKDEYQIFNKSTLSRVESGAVGEKTIIKWAKAYCYVFNYSEKQTDQFLRGDRIAIPDTSALLKNPQLIDELEEEYSIIVIPNIVIRELTRIKDKKVDAQSKRAWEIIRSIGHGNRILEMTYSGDEAVKNDEKIIAVAEAAAEKYGREVQIITNDADYSAYLKGNKMVKALFLREYIITKQRLVNMMGLVELDRYYADSYENICAPNADEINAFLPDGNTLIISVVKDKKHHFHQKKEKIQWLIDNGADVDKRDCQCRYFPPLTHAIQMNDYRMFLFLLNECHANPNIGSRNPHDAGKLRQRAKNEGNTPLMVAAWHGKSDFVRALCDDERTSINQQDANGFTALIKACANGYTKCRDIIIEAGADKKILDINDMTYQDRYNECLELGPMRTRNKRGNRSD